MNNKCISERFLLWDCKASMFGFSNEKTFVCMDKNNIQCYLLYELEEFEKEF